MKFCQRHLLVLQMTNVQIAMLKLNLEVLSAALVASNCQGKTFIIMVETKQELVTFSVRIVVRSVTQMRNFAESVEHLCSMIPFQLEA